MSVNFDVYGQGTIPNTDINMVFTSEDGKDSFTFKPQEGRGDKYNYSREVKVIPGMNYKVESVATGTLRVGRKEYNIEFEDLNPSNNPIEVSGKNSTNQNDTLKLRDGHGSDANVKFTITSTSPGVEAKFSDDGRKLITKGDGDVTIRLKYDDNPNYAGEAVRSITIGGVKWNKERKHKGEETKTLSTSKGALDLVPEQGTLKRGVFGKSKDRGAKESGEKSDVIFADIIGSANDNDDIQIRASVGEFTPSNKRTGIQGTSGQGTQKRNTWDLTFRVDSETPRVKGQEQKRESLIVDPDFLRLSLGRRQNSGVNSCREILYLLLFLPLIRIIQDSQTQRSHTPGKTLISLNLDGINLYSSQIILELCISMATKLQKVGLILEVNLFQLTLKFLEVSMM